MCNKGFISWFLTSWLVMNCLFVLVDRSLVLVSHYLGRYKTKKRGEFDAFWMKL